MVSLRLLLPLVLLCAGGGFVLGRLGYARLGDRPDAPAGAAHAAEAQEALARVRAARDAGVRDDLRRAFLERFPRSWLRTHWKNAP